MRSRIGTTVEYAESKGHRFWCDTCEEMREDEDSPSPGRIANAATKLLELVERTLPSWSDSEAIDVHEMRMAARDLRDAIGEEMAE